MLNACTLFAYYIGESFTHLHSSLKSSLRTPLFPYAFTTRFAMSLPTTVVTDVRFVRLFARDQPASHVTVVRHSPAGATAGKDVFPSVCSYLPRSMTLL